MEKKYYPFNWLDTNLAYTTNVFPIILGEIKLNKNIFLHKTTE
jgi:hypothetical protein